MAKRFAPTALWRRVGRNEQNILVVSREAYYPV